MWMKSRKWYKLFASIWNGTWNFPVGLPACLPHASRSNYSAYSCTHKQFLSSFFSLLSFIIIIIVMRYSEQWKTKVERKIVINNSHSHSGTNCLFKTCIAQNIPDGVRVHILTQTLFTCSQRERELERERETETLKSTHETYNLFLYFTVSSSIDARIAATATSGAGAGTGIGGGGDTFVMPYILIWCLCSFSLSLFMIVGSWKFSRTWCFVVDGVFFWLFWLRCYFSVSRSLSIVYAFAITHSLAGWLADWLALCYSRINLNKNYVLRMYKQGYS